MLCSEEAERVIDETFEETERDEAVIALDSCKLVEAMQLSSASLILLGYT